MGNKFEGNPIAPRLRPGEGLTDVPEGKVPTRHYGQIVFVSERTDDDLMFHNSPYTVRQVGELDAIRMERELFLTTGEGFEAQFLEVLPGQTIINVEPTPSLRE